MQAYNKAAIRMIIMRVRALEVRDKEGMLTYCSMIQVPAPVRPLAAAIFIHETKIFRPPIGPIFFLR